MGFFRNLYEGDPRGKSQYSDSQIMAILEKLEARSCPPSIRDVSRTWYEFGDENAEIADWGEVFG